MNTPSHAPRRAFRIVFAVVAAFAIPAIADCPHDWLPISTPPGIVGMAKAAIAYNDGSGPVLFIGGTLSGAANVRTTGVLRWNGSNWSAAGDPFALSVTAFGIYNGALYAAGRDAVPSHPNAGRIVRWNGQSWQSIVEISNSGSGGFVQVNAITAYNGQIYIAGTFNTVGGVSAKNVARWNGTQWSDVGGGIAGTNSTDGVKALQEFQGTLYAAGRFGSAGQAAADDFARWDGAQWTAVTTELTASSEIFAMAIANGSLILGGRFSNTQEPPIENVASWDGAHLSPLGTGISGGPVLTLGEFNGHIYAGPLSSHNSVVQFDGTAWVPAGNTPLGTADVLTVYGSELFALGRVQLGGFELGVFHWNESTWRPLLTTKSAWITPLAIHHAELMGTGTILLSDGTLKFGLARWDGTDWQPLGMEDIPYPYSNNRTLNAAVSYADEVIVGGRFSSIAGVSVSNIARWTGSEWLPLGQGVNGEVQSMINYHGDLIVSGDFLTAGGAPANRIARWDGAAWSPLDQGLPVIPIGIGIRNDELVAANGAFGPVQPFIARWNGAAWAFDSVDWGGILSFRVVGDAAYAGQDESPILTTNVYSWDGADTSIIGQFAALNDDGIVPCLSEFDGNLVASSTNPVINGLDVGHIARWNGSAWSGFGAGLDGPARAIVQFGDSLFVEGNFSTVGGQVTNGSARWAPIGPAISEQPEREVAHTGQQAAFAVTAADATAFQWRHNGVALNDDAHIAGATTANLTIDPVIIGDAGQYDCILTNTCGSTTSNTAPLRVIATVPGKPTLQPAGQPAPG